jgi:hypothetical protein
MTEHEDEIRAIVRAAIEKHLGGRPDAPLLAPGPPTRGSQRVGVAVPGGPVLVPLHFSFGQYALTRAPGDSRCLIEPSVGCVHCGYCQCHGY